jgi:hypothetical protein
LAFQTGSIQRAMSAPCVADLVMMNQGIKDAQKHADFAQKYPSDIDVFSAVLLTVCDSGHANGNPESDEIAKYKSVGGHYLIIANAGVLDGEYASCAVLDHKSAMTQRVCRSTLAAEASHLADAIEATDWLAVLLHEALFGRDNLDLKNWQNAVNLRKRAYVTDAQSVYDYLTKDGTSQSKDKRMAIEGALLRETMRQPNASARWIDGLQNIADVLTKIGADKGYFWKIMKDSRFSLVQDAGCAAIKEVKRAQRAARKVTAKVSKDAEKEQRRQQAAEMVGDGDGLSSE